MNYKEAQALAAFAAHEPFVPDPRLPDGLRRRACGARRSSLKGMNVPATAPAAPPSSRRHPGEIQAGGSSVLVPAHAGRSHGRASGHC